MVPQGSRHHGQGPTGIDRRRAGRNRERECPVPSGQRAGRRTGNHDLGANERTTVRCAHPPLHEEGPVRLACAFGGQRLTSPSGDLRRREALVGRRNEPGQAVEELEALVAARELAPETRAVLEENLAVIERAIEESRAAVRADPQGYQALESLRRMYDAKVVTLRTVAVRP
jgi:hypothetical protein